MSYVDMMGGARWSQADHVAQVEARVRMDVTHTREHVVIRRMFQMLLPLMAAMLPRAPSDGSPDPYATVRATLGGLVAHCAPVTPAQFAEILAAASVFSDADVLAEAARVDSARLELALDFEQVRTALESVAAALQALPGPVLTDGTDDPLLPEERAAVEEQRTDLQAQAAGLQAQLDAASADTLALVAQRDAARLPPTEPDPAPAIASTSEGQPA